MPDIPEAALAAAERAIIEAATDFGTDNVAGPSRDLARAAAAPDATPTMRRPLGVLPA
jgi:hypothetical protein